MISSNMHAQPKQPKEYLSAAKAGGHAWIPFLVDDPGYFFLLFQLPY